MAILTVSGQAGLRVEDIGRQVAAGLDCELVTQARLDGLYQSEIPARGYADIVTSMVARQAAERRVVFTGPGAAHLFGHLPDVLRVLLVARPAVRAGALMIERGLERPGALAALRELDREQTGWMRARFRRGAGGAAPYDLTVNLENRNPEAVAAAIVAAARALGFDQAPVLAGAAERQVQFEVRLRLARLGVAAPGAAPLASRQFAHPSEEIFANLLDFYRIAWEYEPRLFPIEWDGQGAVTEAFTPDFYLPELDLYVELTTMKQSLVTKKNRKIKRLRELYPEVNVQVFYQKDFENLIFKYGLERTAEMIG